MKTFLFLFTVLALVSSSLGQTTADQPQLLKYHEFIEKLQAGQIKSVTLGPISLIEGTYSQDDAQVGFICERTVEAVNDPLLTELLEQKKISIGRKAPPEPGAGAMIVQSLPFILLLFIPAVLLVFVLIYVVRINNKFDQVIIR